MMDNLRTVANSPVLKIVFVIIILSLTLTNIGGYLISDSSNYTAKVNGTIISQAQFQQAFQQEKQASQDQLGDQLTEISNNEQSIKIMQNQALERLIKVTLLNQYSNQLGLTASDDQIKQHIYNLSVFQTDGHFDNKKYRAILSQYHININDFAEEIRQSLTNRQLSKLYLMDEFVLPEEAEIYAQLLLQQREVKTATLFLSNYQQKQTATDKELQDYYNGYQSDFISPKQVQISYIKLDAASLYGDKAIKNEELKSFYEQNIANYTEPMQKHYSMIQLSTKKKADAIINDLASGVDFKKLAAEKSTDKFSAENNGSLGWMDETTTPSEIISANLTKKGQISSIIKSANNYIIFRLNDIKPEIVKPFQSVRAEIADSLKNEKAINAFHLLQQTVIRAAINENESLTAVEKVTGTKAVTTDWFSRNNLPEEIRFNQVANAIFSGNLLDKNKQAGFNLDIINIDASHAFVVRIEKYKPETIKSFDEVKKTVAELVKLNKAIKKIKTDGNKLLTALKNGEGETTLKEFGISFGDNKIINRFWKNNLLAEEIFQMPIPKKNIPTYFISKDAENNLVIIQLLKVIQGQPTQEELTIFSQRYRMLVSNEIVESMILNLRDKAKIELGRIM